MMIQTHQTETEGFHAMQLLLDHLRWIPAEALDAEHPSRIFFYLLCNSGIADQFFFR